MDKATSKPKRRGRPPADDEPPKTPLTRRFKARCDLMEMSPSGACKAAGVDESFYRKHNSGALRTATLDTIEKLAGVLRVKPSWLGFGEASAAPQTVPVRGYVGAGDRVEGYEDSLEAIIARGVVLPPLEAYIVRGRSQEPRFFEGDVILVEPPTKRISDLVDQLAVVQTDDEHHMYIKTVRRGRGDDRWTLESPNGKAIKNVTLRTGWRFVGMLASNVLVKADRGPVG